MKNFIVLFEEKEGTSPLMRLLDNFDDTTVVRHDNDSGWEPFDTHNCGRMSDQRLVECMQLMYGHEQVDDEALNKIYTQTGTRPLIHIGQRDILGFKMRFKPANGGLLERAKFSSWNDFTRGISNNYLNRQYKQRMFEVFRQHNVVVFFAVRQDVMKWALSKYHGDGSGKKGHMQFQLASGKLKRDDVKKITVDIRRMAQIVRHCQYVHAEKKALFAEMQAQGIHCAALKYEGFLEDKTSYMQELYAALGVSRSEEEIQAAIDRGAYFEKVHKDDISSFVVNHEEVQAAFSSAFVPW